MKCLPIFHSHILTFELIFTFHSHILNSNFIDSVK